VKVASTQDIPFRALSSFATARRRPLTSSFSLPVSVALRSWYSSSFSSCSCRIRWFNPPVTVAEPEKAEVLEDADAAAFMWGKRTETSAGGRVTGSVVEGPGCLDRYVRRVVISSCSNARGRNSSIPFAHRDAQVQPQSHSPTVPPTAIRVLVEELQAPVHEQMAGPLPCCVVDGESPERARLRIICVDHRQRSTVAVCRKQC